MDIISPEAKKRLIANREAEVVRESRRRRREMQAERRARPTVEESVEVKLDMVYGVPKPKPKVFLPTKTTQSRNRKREAGTAKALKLFHVNTKHHEPDLNVMLDDEAKKLGFRKLASSNKTRQNENSVNLANSNQADTIDNSSSKSQHRESKDQQDIARTENTEVNIEQGEARDPQLTEDRNDEAESAQSGDNEDDEYGYSDEDDFEDDFEDDDDDDVNEESNGQILHHDEGRNKDNAVDLATSKGDLKDDWLAAAGADDEDNDDDDDDDDNEASQSYRSPLQRPSSATSNRSDSGSPSTKDLEKALAKVTNAINASSLEDPVPPSVIMKLLRAATNIDFSANGQRGSQLAQRTCVALQCLVEDEGEEDHSGNTIADRIVRSHGVTVLATILRCALARRQYALASSCCNTGAIIIEKAARAQNENAKGSSSSHSSPQSNAGVFSHNRATVAGARMLIIEISTLLVTETDSALKVIATVGSATGGADADQGDNGADWTNVADSMDVDGLLSAQESACRLLRVVSEHGGPHGAEAVARILDNANDDSSLDPWTRMSRDTVGALIRLLVLTPPASGKDSDDDSRNKTAEIKTGDHEEESDDEDKNSRKAIRSQLNRLRNESIVTLLSLVVRCMDNASYVKSYTTPRILLEQRQQLMTNTEMYPVLVGSEVTGVSILASAINEFHHDQRVQYLAPHATAKMLSSSRKKSSVKRENGAMRIQKASRRPKSSPLVRAIAAHKSENSSEQDSEGQNLNSSRKNDFQYTPGQWAAPSLETLAREFKEVVKTAHRIRINDAAGNGRKGKGLSEEAALAISRCESRRNYLLGQIREHELRRVQRARIRQRERVLARKAIEREKSMQERKHRVKHANDGRPGFPEKQKGKQGKTIAKHSRKRPASSAALLRSHRPDTPSALTRFKQRDFRHEDSGSVYSNFDTQKSFHRDIDMRSRVEMSIRTRPHSSPPRRQRGISSQNGKLLSPMQRSALSTPALHAVFSPQVPYYEGGQLAQAREKRKWSARKERRRQTRREQRQEARSEKPLRRHTASHDDFLDSDSEPDVDTEQKKKRSTKNSKRTRKELRNKFGEDILGPSPSLNSFQRLQRRPISAVRPRSPDQSRFPSQDANSVNFGSQHGHFADPSSQWYTGHHTSDTAKLQQNVNDSVKKYQKINSLNRGEGKRPATASASGRSKSRNRAKRTTVQGAKDLLRMVQAQRVTSLTMDPILQNGNMHLDPKKSALELSDPSRPQLPEWSTSRHRSDIDSALVALERYETGFAESESGSGSISDLMSPYRRFPTFVGEPDFSAKGIGKPALADPLYGPHEQLAKMRALGIAPSKRHKMKKKLRRKKSKRKRPATGGARLDPHRTNAIGGGYSGFEKHRPKTSTGIRKSFITKRREGSSSRDQFSTQGSDAESTQDESINISTLEPTSSNVTGGGITDNGSVVIPSTDGGLERTDKIPSDMDALLADLEAAEAEEERLLEAKRQKNKQKVNGVIGGEKIDEPPLILIEGSHMVENPQIKGQKNSGKKKKKKKKKRRPKKRVSSLYPGTREKGKTKAKFKTKKQKQALAAEQAALAEAESKAARRKAGLEKYRKRNLQQKNYKKSITAKAKVTLKKQQAEGEEKEIDAASPEDMAAIRVQSAVRKRQSHVRVKEMRAQRDKAARGLQRIARGKRDRRRVSLLQNEKEAERVHRVQMARELQRVARGRASRNRVKRLRKLSAVEKDAAEEAVRREKIRQEDEEKERQLMEASEDMSRNNEEQTNTSTEQNNNFTRANRVGDDEIIFRQDENKKTKLEESQQDRQHQVQSEVSANLIPQRNEKELDEGDDTDEYGNLSFESAATPMKTTLETDSSNGGTIVSKRVLTFDSASNVEQKLHQDEQKDLKEDRQQDSREEGQLEAKVDLRMQGKRKESVEEDDSTEDNGNVDTDDYGNVSFESAATPIKSTLQTDSSGDGATDSKSGEIFGPTSKAPSKNPALAKYAKGDRVETQLDDWAKAYAGEINEEPIIRSDGSISYSIQFDDGEVRSSVSERLLKLLDGNLPQPLKQGGVSETRDDANVVSSSTPAHKDRLDKTKIANGDRVQAKCSGWSKAYPGNVIDEPMIRSDGTVSYSIMFDDGEIRSSVEGNLVSKIGSESEISTPVLTATDGDGEKEANPDKTMQPTLSTAAVQRFSRGDRIEAQCSGWAKAYAGEVMAAPLVRSDGTVSYSIRFDDGEERQNIDGNLVTPIGGWGAKQSPPLEKSIDEENEESVSELDQAEKQLAKDLAELQALMAEHSDLPGDSSTSEKDEHAKTSDNQTAKSPSPQVQGSILGANESDEEELSQSSSSMSDATFESEDYDDDVFFG